jgi:pilus assembly protein CpaC
VKLRISIIERKMALAIRGAALSLAAAAMLILAAPTVCPAQGAARPSAARASIVDVVTSSGGLDSVSRSASEGKTLHVTIGHSIFLDTKTRLRRVYIADPAILSSVTLTPNEIVVTAMAPGVSSLTLLDEAGQAENYVVSADIDIDGLRQAIAETVEGSSVKIDGSGSRVTLSGIVASQAMADDAVKLAGLYSKEVANAMTVTPGHPKQVRLEVRIIEVDRTKLLQLGINLFNPGGNTNFLATTTTGQYPSTATAVQSALSTLVTASNPLNFFLYSAKLNLGATIQDLQNKQILQILAEPTITTVSGVKADFLSGGEFPFPVVQPGGNGGAPVVTISFRPYGVKLEFTPIVNADGTITLTVAPEVSALDYSNSVNIGGFSVPALSTRRASTEVELRSNQSFAISGLLDQRTTDILNKTPGAANIPILGALFKSKNVNHSTTELIVVVTPTVVDPLTETTVPDQPVLPIPTLDTGAFDRSLGKNAKPNPTAPPLTPAKPPMGNLPPAAPPAPAPAASTEGAPSMTPASSTGTTLPATPAANTETAPAATPATTQTPAPPASPAAAVALVAPEPINTVPGPVAANKVAVGPSKLIAAATALPAADSLTVVAATQPNSMVEVMALSHESDAEVMVAALNRHGYRVAVRHEPQDSLLHLDVGPFADQKDAETMRQRLLADGYNATIK